MNNLLSRERILNVSFDNFNFSEFVEIVLSLINNNENITIALSNPEFLLEAKKNMELLMFLNSITYNVADGIGVIWASKILFKNPLSERITGTDFLPELIKRGYKYNLSYFFVGGRPGIAESAASNFKKMFGNNIVIHTFHGYFDFCQEDEIIAKINSVSPDVLMVCLGNPKQELFISRNRDRLNARLIFGNGGALDFWANEVKRAPIWMQNMGLEWIFRLYQDPSKERFKRQIRLIKFPFLVFIQFARQGFKRI